MPWPSIVKLCFGEAYRAGKTNEKFTSTILVFHQGFIDGLGLTLNENHIVQPNPVLDDKQKWRKLLGVRKLRNLKQRVSNFGSRTKVYLERSSTFSTKSMPMINTTDYPRSLNIVYWAQGAKRARQNNVNDKAPNSKGTG